MDSTNNVSEYMCPKNETEFKEITDRIVSNRFFRKFSQAVWGDTPIEKTGALVKSLSNTDEFQYEVIKPFIYNMLSVTSDGFTYSGTEHLEKGKGYLFVSNHRDIVVDPLLLEYVMMDNGMPTTDITIGNNLLGVQFLVDLARLNKIFRVVRNSKSIKDYMLNSMLLSKFLRDAIAQGRSAWIAQRNGRAKDGNDLTDRGLVKMLDMSASSKDVVVSYEQLHIVPLSVSYEIESCDYLKAFELYKTSVCGQYVKTKHEDMNSILTGVTQPKGHIHLSICEPLSCKDFDKMKELSKNDFQKVLADLIDRRIYDSYRLFPFNYVAHDIRSGIDRFIDKYDRSDVEAFQKRLEILKSKAEGMDYERLRSIFLGIYANPVDKKDN